MEGSFLHFRSVHSIETSSRRQPTPTTNRAGSRSGDLRRDSTAGARPHSPPSHLVPLCIDTATSNQHHFRYVLDVVHLINCLSLRYYVRPASDDFFEEKREENRAEMLSSHHTEIFRQVRMPDVLGRSSCRIATGLIFDEASLLRGEISLIGAAFHAPDQHNSYNVGIYSLEVPNHTFYLKPLDTEQNQLLLASLPRWIQVANSPYFDSQLAFICMKLKIVEPKDANPNLTAEEVKAKSPAQDAAIPRHINGIEIGVFHVVPPRTVYEAERDLSNVEKGGAAELEALPQPQDILYFPLGKRAPAGHNRDGEPQGQQQLTSRHQCVFVVPFELASPMGIRISIDHALFGSLSPVHNTEPLRLGVLFGRHKDEQHACVIPVCDSRSTKCRATISLWWVPATHRYVTLRLSAASMFRPHFVFSDPFLRLRLKSENKAANATSHLHGGWKKSMSETIYQSEVYYNMHHPNFLPIALALPPTYEYEGIAASWPDSAPPTRCNTHTDADGDSNIESKRRPLALFSILPKSSSEPTELSQSRRPSLAAFVAPIPHTAKTSNPARPQTARVRSMSNRTPLCETSVRATMKKLVNYRSPLFAESALPRVAVPEDSPLMTGTLGVPRKPGGGLYFGVAAPFPTVLLKDRIVCDVFDAVYDETTEKCNPEARGSFSFTVAQLLRAPSGRLSVSPPRRSGESGTDDHLYSPNSTALSQRRDASSTILSAVIRRGYASIPVPETSLSSRDIKVFVPGGIACGRSHLTNVRITQASQPTMVHIDDVIVNERLTFQHFLNSEWELSSVIVVDFLGGALPLHRTARFANGWNIFHGILVAINTMLVPLMSRNGSDIFGCGFSFADRVSMFPIHLCSEIFGQAVDEMTQTLSHSVSFKGVSEAAPQSADGVRDPHESSRSATPHPYAGRLPFSLVKDWTGESALPYYEAKRVGASKSESAVCCVPFQMCPVLRRSIARCDALQRARQQGLSAAGAQWTDLGVGSKLMHVVSILIGTHEIADLSEAVEVLQLASAKPIFYVIVFIDWREIPSVLATLPNVITVDFRCGEFLQLHHSFSTLREAFNTLPSFFLYWARLNLVQPLLRRHQTAYEDSDVVTTERDEDIQPSMKKVSRASSPQEAFVRSADRFSRAFGFRRKSAQQRMSRLSDSLAIGNGDERRSPRGFETEGEFTKPETFVFAEDGANVADPAASEQTLRNATMTIVDLYMNRKQLAKKATQDAMNLEVDKRYDAAVSTLLTRKHMQLLRERQITADRDGQMIESDVDTASEESDHGGDAPKFEILEERREMQNRALWSVLPKPPKGDDRDSVTVGDASVREAPRTVTSAGLHQATAEPGRYKQLLSVALGPRGRSALLPEPPRCKPTARFASYNSATMRKTVTRIAQKWRIETRNAFNRYKGGRSRLGATRTEALDWGEGIPPNTLTPQKQEKLKALLARRPQPLAVAQDPAAAVLTRAQEAEARERLTELMEKAKRDTEMFELRDEFAREGEIMDEWMGVSIVPKSSEVSLPGRQSYSPAPSRSEEGDDET